MFVVPAPADRPELRAQMAEAMLPLIVHLPCYGEMPESELRHVAEEVRSTVEAKPRTVSKPSRSVALKK